MYKLIYILPIAFMLACDGSPEEGPQQNEVVQELTLTQLVSSNPSVKTGKLSEVSVHGEIKCTGRIDIPPTDVFSAHARATGYISKVNFIQGDHIKKGTLLAQIENPDFINDQRSLLETRIELNLAQQQLERQQSLDTGGATTSKALEQAANNRDLLKARYEGIREKLLAVGFDVGKLENEGVFQRTLNIYSPTAGIVESVDVNIGKLVHPDDRIMRIVNYHHIHLELQVFSRDVQNVKIGQQIEFYVPGNAISYKGDVVKISPSINPESGTFMVHCHIEDAATIDVIKPGLFVNATIFTGEKTIYGLPKDAVVKEGLMYYAYLVEDDVFAKTALEDIQEYRDYYSFRVPQELLDADWVISGAYYIQ